MEMEFKLKRDKAALIETYMDLNSKAMEKRIAEKQRNPDISKEELDLLYPLQNLDSILM